MKKALAVLVITLLCLTPFSVFAQEQNFLVEIEMDSGEAQSVSGDVTEWYFRLWEGVFQQRLWSHTRGEWLTPWLNCPVG